ncbi:MAG: hypothetical protein J7M19_07220 [Planctomycetes bacterium]|nr:hypothetical protein [Planctomycetota bacterium]
MRKSKQPISCTLAAALFAGMLVWGCRSGRAWMPPAGRPVTNVCLTQGDELVGIKQGHFLAVYLPGDRAGGAWAMTRKPDAGILKGTGRRRVGRSKDSAAPAGDVIFYFEAISPGVTDFVFRRSGPANTPAGEEFALTVYTYY